MLRTAIMLVICFPLKRRCFQVNPPRTMISEAVFREFLAKTLRKLAVSGQNLLENARNSKQNSNNCIRLSVLAGSWQFRSEPDKSGHRIRSWKYCFHEIFEIQWDRLFDLGFFCTQIQPFDQGDISTLKRKVFYRTPKKDSGDF
jgi:hypothetical protein